MVTSLFSKLTVERYIVPKNPISEEYVRFYYHGRKNVCAITVVPTRSREFGKYHLVFSGKLGFYNSYRMFDTIAQAENEIKRVLNLNKNDPVLREYGFY